MVLSGHRGACLVHLGTIEVVAVHHRNGLFAAQLQAIEVLARFRRDSSSGSTRVARCWVAFPRSLGFLGLGLGHKSTSEARPNELFDMPMRLPQGWFFCQ